MTHKFTHFKIFGGLCVSPFFLVNVAGFQPRHTISALFEKTFYLRGICQIEGIAQHYLLFPVLITASLAVRCYVCIGCDTPKNGIDCPGVTGCTKITAAGAGIIYHIIYYIIYLTICYIIYHMIHYIIYYVIYYTIYYMIYHTI